MKRIAVCLYGQPRTWKKCGNYIEDSYSSLGYETDYFISTKDYNEYMNIDGGNYVDVSSSEIQELIEFFNPVRYNVLSKKPEHPRPNGWVYSNMFRSIIASILMCREHSADYDVVVLTRFDVALGPTVDQFRQSILHNVEPLTIYSNERLCRNWPEFGKVVPDDTIMIGQSQSMFIMADALLRFLSTNNTQDYELLGPNVAVSKAMQLCNLASGSFPGNIAIIRPHETDKTLYTDFKYYADHWRSLSLKKV